MDPQHIKLPLHIKSVYQINFRLINRFLLSKFFYFYTKRSKALNFNDRYHVFGANLICQLIG